MDFQNQIKINRESENETNSATSTGAGKFAPVTSISRGMHFAASASRQHNHPAEEKDPKKIIGFLDGLITVCLGALFLGVPLFFTGLTLQGISFEKQIYFYAWLLIALVAWVSKGVILGEMKIKKTPLDIPIALFWVAMGISMFFSVDRWHSFWGYFGDPSRGFMSVTALIIAYYLIVSHFNKKRFVLVSSLLILTNFLIAIWVALSVMGVNILPQEIARFVPLSPIGSLTGLGIFLSAMLPIVTVFALSLFSEGNSGISKSKKVTAAIFLFLTLVLNLFLLLVLYSFVSQLGLIVGVSFFLIYILAQIVRPSENWSWLPMATFVIILAILIIGSNSIARVQLPVEASPSYQLSFDVAKNSLGQNLLVGSGPATYGYDFSLFKPQNFNLNPYYNLRFFQGTGLFFEAVSTLGIIGSITLILLALTFVSIGVYLLSVNKQKNKLYSLGIFSGALALLINSFAGKMEGSMIILGVLIVALAVSTLLWESDSEENNLTLSLKASPKYALALAFVFMVVSAGVVFLFIFIGRIYAADMRAGSAMREQKITSDGSVTKLAGAISWNNKESRYFILFGQELMSLANDETLKGEKERNLGLIQNYLNDSISSVTQAKLLAPKDVAAVEALAQIYENSGLYVADSFKLAEDNYNQAITLEPHNPAYFVKIGQIKMAQASAKKTPEEAKALVKEAQDQFQKAIDEKSNLAVAHYQLALTKEALDDLDGAVTAIEQAVLLERDNLNYYYNAARIHQARGNDDDNKVAEAVYKDILAKNDKEINTHFSLGLLYEKTKKNSEATAQYKKVIELLSTRNASRSDADGPADNSDVKTKVQKMISNIANGIENKPENLVTESATPPATPAPAVETPTPTAPAATPTAPVANPAAATPQTPVTP